MTQLEDFGVQESIEERVKEHQRRCKQLPVDKQALYWRTVFKAERDLFKYMNGKEYQEVLRRRAVNP